MEYDTEMHHYNKQERGSEHDVVGVCVETNIDDDIELAINLPQQNSFFSFSFVHPNAVWITQFVFNWILPDNCIESRCNLTILLFYLAVLILFLNKIDPYKLKTIYKVHL